MITPRTKLKEARKKRGYTQSQLSNLIGISRAYLANIERGEYTPSLKTAQALSKTLKLKVDDVF